MSGASFGRKGAAPVASASDGALAARRAAFLAEERARREREPERPAPAETKTYVTPKSTSTAYAFWFFFGGLGAHRFYLGSPVSGAIQLALTPISYGLIASKSLSGLAIMPVLGLWLLVDAFLIPGMARAANERNRRDSAEMIFA
jgi:TM2 domain-containing membrane protein YozV